MEKRFQYCYNAKNVRIERIVSTQKIAKTTYIQDQDEWVILLKGNATLTVEEQNINLCAGDYVFLPSQIPHTVVSISQGAVWLAVHLYPEGTPIPNH